MDQLFAGPSKVDPTYGPPGLGGGFVEIHLSVRLRLAIAKIDRSPRTHAFPLQAQMHFLAYLDETQGLK